VTEPIKGTQYFLPLGRAGSGERVTAPVSGRRMDEMRIGDQLALIDREATAAAYTLLPSGGADRCGC